MWRGGATFIGGTLATSLIGGVSTAIFAISHFHRLSTHGLEANLAAMPLISLVVMPSGFIAMLLMPFGLDAPFFWVMGQGLERVLIVAHTVSGWGGGYVFPRLPAWFMPGAIAGMLLLMLLRTPIRHVGTALIVATFAAAFLAPRPPGGELMISEDARLVAVRITSHDMPMIAINRARPAAFIFDQWQPVLGIDEPTLPVMLDTTPLPPASDRRTGQTLSEEQRKLAEGVFDSLIKAAGREQFTCVKQACAIRLENGNTLLTLERADLLGSACDRANIVVLSARTRLTACRSGALLISETNLRATGALEITGLGADSQGRTVRSALDGPSRPWTAHRLYDWRSGSSETTHVFAGPTGTVDQDRSPINQ